MSDEKLRMQAYYYGFSKTDKRPIDLILSAVACAGKSYHLTEDWLNECQSWTHLRGNTPVDWIQNAAADAAADYDAQQARVAELEKQLEREYIRTRHARAQTEVRDDEITSLKSALHDYERMVVASEARIATLEAELAQKTAECVALNSWVTRLTESTEAAGVERDTALAELATARAECERLRGEADALRNSRDFWSEKHAVLSADHDAALSDLSTLRAQAARGKE